jgi:hypothetical protein
MITQQHSSYTILKTTVTLAMRISVEEAGLLIRVPHTFYFMPKNALARKAAIWSLITFWEGQ